MTDLVHLTKQYEKLLNGTISVHDIQSLQRQFSQAGPEVYETLKATPQQVEKAIALLRFNFAIKSPIQAGDDLSNLLSDMIRLGLTAENGFYAKMLKDLIRKTAKAGIMVHIQNLRSGVYTGSSITSARKLIRHRLETEHLGPEDLGLTPEEAVAYLS